MRFDQSIRGLAVGAPIDFSGITLGNVTQINLDFDPVSKRFYSLVDATLYPERLGRVYEEVRDRAVKDGDVAGTRLLGVMIKHGLRAQLRTSNLLTGQLYVVLDDFPNAKPVDFKPSDPAIIPTIPGNLDQLQQQHVQADEPPGQAGGAGSAEHAEAGQGVHGEHQCHAGLGRVPAGQYRKGDAGAEPRGAFAARTG
ncbi:hypothetical protein G6F65_020157 [Rhizopus arrhizus]|nr:hypothetical protein G6F65_020157 [Rhizopus arrhizus]